MANIEELEMKYSAVLKAEDVKKYLTESEKLALRRIIRSIDDGRVGDGKMPASENVYVVINVDEPYIDEIIDTMKVHGHWGSTEEAQ